MKEEACRFNTSLCTLLKFWEAVSQAEKQVASCERAQQLSRAEYKHENFSLKGDLSEANTLRDSLDLASPLLLLRRTYSIAVSPACPKVSQLLGRGFSIMCLAHILLTGALQGQSYLNPLLRLYLDDHFNKYSF